MQIGHAAPADTVSHTLYPVPQHLKTALLMEILRSTETGSVLVFTRTKHRARRLAQQLQQAGFSATSLQGNLSQNQRQAALDGFRSGDFRIMVATDIAARGIDVLDISHVINYDMPDTTDAYTHRIGRTGRAERTGQAYSLMTIEDVAVVHGVERVLGHPLERRMLPGFDYRGTTIAPDRETEREPRQAGNFRTGRRPAPRSAQGQPANGRQYERGPRPSQDAVPAHEPISRGRPVGRRAQPGLRDLGRS